MTTTSTAATTAVADTATGRSTSTLVAPNVVPIGDIVPSPLNPRTHFDVIDLVDSVRKKGVLMPLLTRPRNGKQEIVEGERRYRAAKEAGILFLKIESSDLTDAEALEIMLLANGQREDLTPLEEARGYQRLLATNKAKYSTAYIADRISRSEKYVADRMRLLELIPILQQLLDDERILVGHAELLAKLKPEDQARVAGVEPEDLKKKRPSHVDTGGLWESQGETLEFDDDDEDRDPFAGLKPRSVRELESYIARHVRFDLKHAAATAPLDFGATAQAVELAESKQGRGKKVVYITVDGFVQPDAKTEGGDRIFGPRTWRRADGSKGTTDLDRPGKMMGESPVCDYSITGVFAVGPGYGSAIPVCINRDRCTVHWKAEIAERKRNEQLRAKGDGAKADARETRRSDAAAARQKREDAERLQRNALYRRVYPKLRDAILAATPKATSPLGLDYLYAQLLHGKRPANVKTPDAILSLFVTANVDNQRPRTTDGDGYTDHKWQLDRLQDQAKRVGVDLGPILAAEKKAIADESKAKAKAADAKARTGSGEKGRNLKKAAPAAGAKKTAVKATAKRKAAKKR